MAGKVLSLLVLALVAVCNCDIISQGKHLGEGSKFNSLTFERLQLRVQTAHEMLKEECPELKFSDLKRDLSIEQSLMQQEIERKLYDKLILLLIECRKKKVDIPSTRISTSRPTTTTPTTTSTITSTTAMPTTANATTAPSTKPTTTKATTSNQVPQPKECQSATNLTESWRQDHNGSKIQPGGKFLCDIQDMISSSRPWFRFTGAAGNRMLDSCPPAYSCGSYAAMWTDARLPSTVGVSTLSKVHGSWGGQCKSNTYDLSAMRCSNDTNDVIYRYMGTEWCYTAFCGMQ